MKTHNEEHNLMMRVIFGDEEAGEIGMKKKVDEMHSILTQVKSVNWFFGGVGGWLRTLLVIAAVIGVIKGWWVHLITLTLK